MQSKRGLFSSASRRLDGPGRFLHEVVQSAPAKALLKAVLFSKFPDLADSGEAKLKVTVTLHARAEDESLFVEWESWVIGALSPSAAEIAKSAMRKHGNRTYMATEVLAEIFVRTGDPQVWIDLPEAPTRD